MVEDTKQVRVDNWGIFFLQRLQMFFSKTDFCDLTLQFDGNVQLKVHRLVLNACTEYFQYLEDTCTLGDQVILMPPDLQADVIVPIINFMYTGMLEFQLSLFDRLYRTAQLMNITILIKLLEAQKQPTTTPKAQKRKLEPRKPAIRELPAALPGRKLPVWKRNKTTPIQSHSSSPLYHPPEPKWTAPLDPLLVPDNTPKPTRFEWPDDDFPSSMNLLDTSFDDISYTSRPLLTREDTERSHFDELKQTIDSNCSTASNKSHSPILDMEEMQNYVQEQKIRSVLHEDDEEAIDGDLEEKKNSETVKKIRVDGSSTISVMGDAQSGDLDHEKIVSEILKKYPQLVKKNKNIKLKIMTKNKTPEASPQPVKVLKKQKIKEVIEEPKRDPKNPWVCERCSTADEPVEFVLYYLYRKHMTDIHGEQSSSKMCRYCGHNCNKDDALQYHLYTKHGMKPSSQYQFPKCTLCPYVAISEPILRKHQRRHVKGEIQCRECKLTFNSKETITNHTQITNHSNRTNKTNFDCQYCTKRYPNSSHLFSHVRNQHRNEARRDGIVSIDEPDEVEEETEEEESKDEYILPEIIEPPQPVSKKVNILSNVKVQDRVEQQTVTLEPSSEAEALNNVATGIATSLGLVDIVVLNDNQQLFMEEQQDFRDRQSEFILPELAGRDNFSQGLSSDIGSTDELVMVLTDHDYGDNQEEVANDSNIVVLYSHPVDGQQEQFITSESNIMVNSQTGLLEIRNGTSMSNPHQMVTETPIESIEMIQREIESHGEIKPDNISTRIDEEEMKKANAALVHSLEQGEQIEFVAEPQNAGESGTEIPQQHNGHEEMEVDDAETVTHNEERQVNENEEIQENVTERMEEELTSEEQHSEVLSEETDPQVEQVVEEKQSTELEELPQTEENEIQSQQSEDNEIASQQCEETDTESQQTEQEPQDSEMVHEETVEFHNENEDIQTTEEPIVENCSTDDVEIAGPSSDKQEEPAEPQEESEQTENTEEIPQENSEKPDDSGTKIAILDDWEDTDSQHSDQKNAVPGESVDKLMDDWEDEDDDKKEGTNK